MTMTLVTRELTDEPRRPPFNGPSFTETVLHDGEPSIVVWCSTHKDSEGKTWAILDHVEVHKWLSKAAPFTTLRSLMTDVIGSMNTPLPILYPNTRRMLRKMPPVFMASVARHMNQGRVKLALRKYQPPVPFIILRAARNG